MDKDFLTLKRAPIGPNEEDYDVLFDGVLVGRIVLSPSARNDRQWMWSLGPSRPLADVRLRADARGGVAGVRGVREELAKRLSSANWPSDRENLRCGFFGSSHLLQVRSHREPMLFVE